MEASFPMVISLAVALSAPEPMPGEVEEGGEWWPREAPNGKEVR